MANIINGQYKDNNIYLECDCGCSILEISQWNEADGRCEEVFISHKIDSFYAWQKSGWNKFINRLKIIWSAITGKEYLFYSISILDNDKLQEFKDAVAKLHPINFDNK